MKNNPDYRDDQKIIKTLMGNVSRLKTSNNNLVEVLEELISFEAVIHPNADKTINRARKIIIQAKGKLNENNVKN